MSLSCLSSVFVLLAAATEGLASGGGAGSQAEAMGGTAGEGLGAESDGDDSDKNSDDAPDLPPGPANIFLR